jgi:hypothetical protein
LKHRGKEEAEESKTLPLINTDDADLREADEFGSGNQLQ